MPTDYKPIWLIQDFQDEDSYKKLAQEVTKQGMEVSIIPCVQEEMKKYIDQRCDAIVTNDASHIVQPIIVQASMNTVRYIQKQRPQYIPGPWTTWKNYDCTNYYPIFGEALLNEDYVLLPRSDVARLIDRLFNKIGDGNNLFIRPNSGYKYFTGQLLHKSTWMRDWDWIESFTSRDTLLVLSSPKQIKQEFRFIVANDKIITGSTYNKIVDSYQQIFKDNSAWVLTQALLNDMPYSYSPDPIFVIDTCIDENNKHSIVELNSFSCAGLYNCDLEIIVTEASKIAINDFKDSLNNII